MSAKKVTKSVAKKSINKAASKKPVTAKKEAAPAVKVAALKPTTKVAFVKERKKWKKGPKAKLLSAIPKKGTTTVAALHKQFADDQWISKKMDLWIPRLAKRGFIEIRA